MEMKPTRQERVNVRVCVCKWKEKARYEGRAKRRKDEKVREGIRRTNQERRRESVRKKREEKKRGKRH